MNYLIEKVFAREILDSRGNPTVEVEVTTNLGVVGRASVPSGASTGEYEAIELRDKNTRRYLGRGVKKAIGNVNNVIANTVKGLPVTNQKNIDQIMIELDGTQNKSNLGANAILGVSLAVAHAGALSKSMPLYQYLGEKQGNYLLPLPMMNILNGGSHADNSVDIQEFMVVPASASSFSEALQMGTEIFHNLKNVLRAKKLTTSIGDEGGFAPNLKSNEEAIEVVIEGIINAGFNPGEDVYIALDVAASELYENKKYNLSSEDKVLDSDGMIQYLTTLVDQYPILSIEDGLHEDDWEGWKNLNCNLGKRVQIVGDDLTVTNIERLERSIKEESINAILIKLNQIGTVTETVEAIKLAKKNNFGAIISHRSGETEDTTIADLSVSMGMGQIKTGSASRTDRICKYNQLLRIEEELGERGKLANINVMRSR